MPGETFFRPSDGIIWGMKTAESDETLAARYLDGDARAFRELAARYATPLYNLAWRFTREPMEAENITQETFLRALQALPRISLDQPLKPWFFKIALNLCRQWAERKRPQLFAELDAGDDSGLNVIADDAPSPWEQLQDAELQQRVRQAVERLAPFDQAVITLRYVEELSYEEIAAALELPLNTVRTRLRRAKIKLRRALETGEL